MQTHIREEHLRNAETKKKIQTKNAHTHTPSNQINQQRTKTTKNNIEDNKQ